MIRRYCRDKSEGKRTMCAGILEQALPDGYVTFQAAHDDEIGNALMHAMRAEGFDGTGHDSGADALVPVDSLVRQAYSGTLLSGGKSADHASQSQSSRQEEEKEEGEEEGGEEESPRQEPSPSPSSPSPRLSSS